MKVAPLAEFQARGQPDLGPGLPRRIDAKLGHSSVRGPVPEPALGQPGLECGYVADLAPRLSSGRGVLRPGPHGDEPLAMHEPGRVALHPKPDAAGPSRPRPRPRPRPDVVELDPDVERTTVHHQRSRPGDVGEPKLRGPPTQLGPDRLSDQLQIRHRRQHRPPVDPVIDQERLVAPQRRTPRRALGGRRRPRCRPRRRRGRHRSGGGEPVVLARERVARERHDARRRTMETTPVVDIESPHPQSRQLAVALGRPPLADDAGDIAVSSNESDDVIATAGVTTQQSLALLPSSQRSEVTLQLLERRHHRRRSLVERFAALHGVDQLAQSVRQTLSRGPGLQLGQQHRGVGPQSLLVAPRQHEQQRGPIVIRRVVCSGCRFDDDVGVGASGPEAAESSPARDRAPLEPGTRRGGDLERRVGKVDLGVLALEMNGRGDRLVLQRERDLEQTRNPGRRLQMAQVALERPHRDGGPGTARRRLRAGRRGGERLYQAPDLDGIPQRGSGAVSLDVAQGVGRNVGVRPGVAQQLGLLPRVGDGEAPGHAPVVAGAAPQQGQHRSAPFHRPTMGLQHQDHRAFGPHVSRRRGVEGPAQALLRQHPGLVVGDRISGVTHDVHAPDQSRRALATPDRLQTLVHRHQRARARGIDLQTRAPEVVEIGQAVGECRHGVSGGDLRLHAAALLQQDPMIGTARAHEDTRLAARDGSRAPAGRLDGLPRQLQQDALLRIHERRLARRQAKHRRVEAHDVVEKPSSIDPRMRGRRVDPLGPQPPPLGQGTDQVLGARQPAPQVLGRPNAPREPTCHPHDRHVVTARLGGCRRGRPPGGGGPIRGPRRPRTPGGGPGGPASSLKCSRHLVERGVLEEERGLQLKPPSTLQVALQLDHARRIDAHLHQGLGGVDLGDVQPRHPSDQRSQRVAQLRATGHRSGRRPGSGRHFPTLALSKVVAHHHPLGVVGRVARPIVGNELADLGPVHLMKAQRRVESHAIGATAGDVVGHRLPRRPPLASTACDADDPVDVARKFVDLQHELEQRVPELEVLHPGVDHHAQQLDGPPRCAVHPLDVVDVQAAEHGLVFDALRVGGADDRPILFEHVLAPRIPLQPLLQHLTGHAQTLWPPHGLEPLQRRQILGVRPSNAMVPALEAGQRDPREPERLGKTSDLLGLGKQPHRARGDHEVAGVDQQLS